MVALECENINISPGPLGKCDTSEKGKAEALANLLQTMREVLPYAEQRGVYLPLEPNNRYEGYPFLMSTLAEARAVIEELGTDRSGIVADFFHMNIEERQPIALALLEAGALVRHIHCLDNNRLGPGMGHLDFKPIFAALKAMRYEGWLTVESCPPRLDPKVIATISIRNIRMLEAMLEEGRD